MSTTAAHDRQMTASVTSEVSSVLLNLKKSAAALLQDKERSRHSESAWKERLSERERRVAELEHTVHTEQQKSAAMASTMQEYRAQELYLSRRIRALTLLASELQQRVNKLQGTVKAGEDLQTQNIEKCLTEKQMRTSLMATASEMETRIEELHAAIRTARDDVKDKEVNIATQQGEIASLQTDLADASLQLSVKEEERSKLYQDLLDEKKSAAQMREQLSSVEEHLNTACDEKRALQKCVDRAWSELTDLKNQHGKLWENLKESEAQKMVMHEEKIILEQQMSAITAEQLQHVISLEEKVSRLESVNHQEKLDNSGQRSKVSKEHAVEVMKMRKQIIDLESHISQQCCTLKNADATSTDLRHQLQQITDLRAQDEQARLDLVQKVDELCTDLDSARSCITELEVQRAVAKATGHAVVASMEQANTALNLLLQRSTRDLQDAKQAQEHASHHQEALRQKHDQQLLEMRELMEAGKTAQTEAMLAQRRQMEAEMRSSLCMLEEQAAKHVRSVQQSFTMAQSHAAEKEHECNHLNDRVNELAAQIEVLNNAKKATQSHWEIKETQMCKAMQDERQAHQSITKEMNEKYEAACANHASSLRQAQEEMQALSKARQSDLQEHTSKMEKSELLYASLQHELDACRLKLSELNADADIKNAQLKSLEVEVQRKAILLKSISDKIATPDAVPMPNATVEPLNNNETSTMPGPSKKRRHENKADSITKDASTAAKRLSRKKGNMPPKHPRAADDTKFSRCKGDSRRGRMAHMSCTATGKENSGKVGGLTSTEIFGGLLSRF